ncbi:uncharacterized protein F5Z01DRAFT_663171 [Emericellopsis atlantica]|uniref:Zn(2)-C6 fungal-type domain-containing protein n=1 Tax=Emericellopsis atlantica TaxID=2614577 RepID=A0A9P7ZGJ2_9HYPO|nr:uncharacterized protein F5Z01DRAFT_663171 [Emericellopsis atlantica]KAG9251605.1 hypothetical protein F5Z01DRAFT_663171 [Emericellopsis atlantica]
MAPPDLTPRSGTSSSNQADGSPAGYGRSCTNCSRAKCKCIFKSSVGSCERCHRLGKDCQPIAASRKRVEKRQTPSRTAQLEEKLDDLVSILRSTQGGSMAGIAGGRQPFPPMSAESSYPPPPTSRLDSLATAATATDPHGSNNAAAAAAYPAITKANNSNLNANYNESDDNSEPTPAEAELYLQKFRAWQQNLPFMVLPPNMDAAQLRQESPFLWLCIMNITSMSLPQMQALKERVRRELAESMVIRHEPSMDIIQGLIAYLSWSLMNSGPGWKPFLILFSQLAMSACYELGLTRSSAEEEHFARCFKAWVPRPPQVKLRTSEERRALVSLWYLISIISTFIGKTDSLRWTNHMEECLEALDQDKEHIQDTILVSLVRIQLIADETHKLVIQDVLKGETFDYTPSYVYRKTLLSRLRILREGMGPVANSSYVVQAHLYATEVMINSLGFFKPSVPEAQRLDSMYSCLRAVRGWYDVWFSIPMTDIPGLPFALLVQLSHVQVALYRLSTSDDPAWDKDVLRNTADLLLILDKIIERFEAMQTVYPMKTGKDDAESTLWCRATKIIKNIKASWEPTLTQNYSSNNSNSNNSNPGFPTPNSQGHGVPVNGGGIPIGMGHTMDPSLPDPTAGMGFVDLPWMMDMFGPWEFN